MEVAIREARRLGPAQLVVAVPAAPRDTIERLMPELDDFVVLDKSPYYLGAVGAYYDNFPQISDAEVVKLMQAAQAPKHGPGHGNA